MSTRTLKHALIAPLVVLATLVAGTVVAAPAPASAHMAALRQARAGQLPAPIRHHRYVYISQWYTGRWPWGHNGIDFAARRGTPIRAVAPGRVVRVRRLHRSYGKYVVIRHVGGRTLDAHMRSIAVHRGEHVRRGQMIGRVGQTGNATGPHLHFTMFKHGHTVNPAPYIWRWAARRWYRRH